MFEISVTCRFTATHQLHDSTGPTEPLHGHDWRVTVVWAGERLDPQGLLLDFTAARRRIEGILAELAGRSLNDVPAFAARNPSAENVARHVAEQLADGPPGVRLAGVEVEEEPGCVARYLPPASAT